MLILQLRESYLVLFSKFKPHFQSHLLRPTILCLSLDLYKPFLTFMFSLKLTKSYLLSIVLTDETNMNLNIIFELYTVISKLDKSRYKNNVLVLSRSRLIFAT